jgi:uncharacterized coiled-coil protein SlyX
VPPEESSREALVALVAAQVEVIDGLRAALVERERRVREQEARRDELAAEVAKLRWQLSRNSRHSSLPPSSDGVILGREAPTAEKAGDGGGKRRRGKQPGADGTALAWTDPDRVEALYPAGGCACGAVLEQAEVVGIARSHQSHDLLPITRIVVQHDLYRVRCG